MWYSKKQVCDTLGRSTAWFSKVQTRYNGELESLYQAGHRKEGKGNKYFYDDEVLQMLRKLCVSDDEIEVAQATAQAEPTDNAQDSAQNAPEAPTSPVEPFCDSKSVIPQKTELDALQAKYDALQALYDKQCEITDILKEQVKDKQTEINQLHQLLAREQEHTLRLNPPVTVEPPADAEPTEDEADEAEPERKHGKLYRWFHRRKDKE